MISLDEAIKHCEEKAKSQRELAKSYNRNVRYRFENPYTNVDEVISKCEKCAEEHEQLMDWLKELKAYKERPQGEWIILYENDGTPIGYKCPYCDDEPQIINSNFCTNCGADMRKGGAENDKDSN